MLRSWISSKITPQEMRHLSFVAAISSTLLSRGSCFQLPKTTLTRALALHAETKKDNKAMAFLRKIGKVGGQAHQDFKHVVGIDEGSAGKQSGMSVCEIVSTHGSSLLFF